MAMGVTKGRTTAMDVTRGRTTAMDVKRETESIFLNCRYRKNNKTLREDEREQNNSGENSLLI